MTISYTDIIENPLFHIDTTPYGGRGCFASVDIPANTQLLECKTPLTFSVFRPYRKDICAYCFKCDFHKSCKVKIDTPPFYPTSNESFKNSAFIDDLIKSIFVESPSSLHPKQTKASQSVAAYASLFFCSQECRNSWIQDEDFTGIISWVLNFIDQKVQESKNSTKTGNVPESEIPKPLSKATVQAIWDKFVVQPGKQQEATNQIEKKVDLDGTNSNEYIKTESKRKKNKKGLKKHVPVLDTEELDMARFTAAFLVKVYIYNYIQNLDDSDLSKVEMNKLSFKLDGLHFFEQLQSNEIEHLQTFPEVLASEINVYNFLKLILPRPLSETLTQPLFRNLLGRSNANSFGIWQLPITPESELLGSALYPIASFFNHACSNNVDKIRKGRSIIFQTIKDIPAGSQLYINYGMYQDMKYEERQKTLKEQWYFECQCERCLNKL